MQIKCYNTMEASMAFGEYEMSGWGIEDGLAA